MAKQLPNESFLKGSGVLKLIAEIRNLERENKTLKLKISELENPKPDTSVAEIVWPKARDVGRLGGMSPAAHLRVGLDGDSDVYVSVRSDEGGAAIEFCTPGSGGGDSPATRTALIALMVAIEKDNAQRSEKDW